MGTVGLKWQIIGVGNFSSTAGETDMIMRNNTTGGMLVYDIANNQITNVAFLGTVGLEWQFVGVAPVHGPGASDVVLRNVNTGQFEVYNIANNQIRAPRAWVRSGWIGRRGALRPIRRAHPWVARTLQILSSYKQWRVLAAAAAQAVRIAQEFIKIVAIRILDERFRREIARERFSFQSGSLVDQAAIKATREFQRKGLDGPSHGRLGCVA